MRTNALLAATGLALGTLAAAGSAAASEYRHSGFSHAGGFICGELGATNNRVLGGDHRTNFNIRNGNDKPVTVDLELALTFPSADPAPNGASFTPGVTTSLHSVDLHPGEAVMIDCDEIFTAIEDGALDADPPPYFSGILDAISNRRLQVTRTQTAGPNGEDITSLSVTEIESTRR